MYSSRRHSKHYKSDFASASNRRLNKALKFLSTEDRKHTSNISHHKHVSSNLAKPIVNTPEKSESVTNFPFQDIGRVSFHVRDRIAAIISSATYIILNFIDHFTENSEIGKEFVKYVN